jgi:hypothetical protein
MISIGSDDLDRNERGRETDMMTRREIVTGGIAAGALGAPDAGAAAGPLQQRDAEERMVSLLGEIRDTLKRGASDCNANACPEMERVRTEQRNFLKGHSKFPDCIDVGADIWDRLCDWHIEHGVVLQVSRNTEGRYTLPFYQTFIVLRPDMANSYVGQGYDR